MERDIQPLLNTLCTAEQNAAVHNGSCTALAGALLPIEETSSDRSMEPTVGRWGCEWPS